MDPSSINSLATIATIFSGGQLAVIVFVLMELRALRKSNDEMKAQQDQQDKHISSINSRLANVMGRLKIPYTDEET